MSNDGCCSKKGITILSTVFLLTFFFAGSAFAAISYDLYGYRANEGGGGAISTPWTKGNLGNTWAEGEWVPYQLVVENPDGPAFADADSFIISFDFTRFGGGGSYARFVDLIRSIQVGTVPRNDDQGWVQAGGSAFPDGTRPEIEIAQNDPGENEWTNFHLLNLPQSQINLTLAGGLDTPPGEDRHIFYIKRTDLVPFGLQDESLLVFYFQLHESRTFIWDNSLQAGYDAPPADDWGGYLYNTDGWPSESTVGSGYVPGSSGHIHLEDISGSRDVPIPIPERLPGSVYGLKFLDVNGDSTYDGGDETLSGWQVTVSGEVEGIMFSTSTLTDEFGNYEFPSLTSGTWIVSEDEDRFDPYETGYVQTYTNPFSAPYEQGTPTAIAEPGQGPWGWSVELDIDHESQADMNFGNKLCEIVCTDPPDITIECTDSTDPDFTGWPTVESNCPPVDTSYSDQVEGSCPTVITRTWTFTDDAGNQSICDQIITVDDTTDPVITCPPDITFECEMGDPGTATATDNCDSDPDVDYTDNVVNDRCPTIIERTWTATDSCGNTDSCVQTITIDDTTDPVITCPPDIAFECEMGDPGVATATDNCDPDPEIDYTDNITSERCPIIIERTWTATDSCGNTDSCMQTITIDDTIDPVITCPPDIAFECEMGDPGVATATDNCDQDPEIGYTDNITSERCPIIIERTWTATDSCGNTDSCVQTITIDDTIDPVITCPPDIAFECEMGDPGVATATDNCDPDPEIGYTDNITSERCPIIIERTWTATDSCGNTDSCVQTITIDDTIDPVITCPPDIVFECEMGDPGVATATDNCDQDPEVDYTDNITSERCPIIIERTWTATDSCGNTDSCVQTITIDDTIDPVITCPPDIVFECEMGDPGVATATDNCDQDPEVTYNDNIMSPRCPIIIERTWIATDSCGNYDSCVQMITIDDTTDPVLTCPPDIAFECEMGDPGVATATDNCDPNPDVDYTDDVVSESCPYIVERTWTATDSCGNTDSCVQTITVDDTQDPVITCADDQTFACDETPYFTDPTVSDNCDSDPDIIMTYTDTPDGPGTYQRCWIAVDSCGNESDECCQTITVEPCPCTFTIGGWGTECPDPAPEGHPGCIRDEYFDFVFPGGSVSIGHPDGHTATWTSSQAIADFLPDGSTPGVLDQDYLNPDTTSAGVLASQILALRLNVEYSCAGVFTLGFPTAGDCLGEATVPDYCSNGMFDGLTVYEFLALADSVVAGLNVPGVTPSDVNYTATCLNESGSDCDPFAYLIFDPDEGSASLAKPATDQIPTVFSLGQNKPNPFNPVTEIQFGLPTDSHVRLVIYNVTGQKVTTLVDEHRQAGMHTVIWNGSSAASGIYFYRLEAGDFVETKKMMLIK
jgi:hypothetical protein